MKSPIPDLISSTHKQLRMSQPKNSFACGLKYLQCLTDSFQDFYTSEGYAVKLPVRITEQLDRTVRFIGAPISALKPYFLEGRIPAPGIIMVQNCIRTRNLKSLFDLEILPKYGSFFTGMCVLTPYKNLGKLCADTMKFLRNSLGLEYDEIRININREDIDLHQAVSKLAPRSSINFNTMPPSYYRHKYGLDGIWGRNFNIALRNVRTGAFEDIGNIIVIENEKEKLGVELALGDTTILQLILGLDHILDCYNFEEIKLDKLDPIRRKLEDVIITCLALYREGLRPSGKTTQARILRSYMQALSNYRRLASLDMDELAKIIEIAEKSKLPFASRSKCDEIIFWIEEYEDQLSNQLIRQVSDVEPQPA